MRTRAELEFDHDKSHQMRNARCEMRPALNVPISSLLDLQAQPAGAPEGFSGIYLSTRWMKARLDLN